MSFKPLLNRVYMKSVFSIDRFYQSAYNIKKLYPNSQENVDYKTIETEKLEESSREFSGFIPTKELTISYSKSSGPGGQNVNKVNTKVEMRFHVETATWIPVHLKSLFAKSEAGRITKDGVLVVTSDKTRKQLLNQADCLAKIRSMLWQCQQQLHQAPSQDTIDILIQRKEKARLNVLREKREHSLKKQARHQSTLS